MATEGSVYTDPSTDQGLLSRRPLNRRDQEVAQIHQLLTKELDVLYKQFSFTAELLRDVQLLKFTVELPVNLELSRCIWFNWMDGELRFTPFRYRSLISVQDAKRDLSRLCWLQAMGSDKYLEALIATTLRTSALCAETVQERIDTFWAKPRR